MFLTKLCRNDMKPPFLQDRACRRSNFSPHSQHAGSLVSVSIHNEFEWNPRRAV